MFGRFMPVRLASSVGDMSYRCISLSQLARCCSYVRILGMQVKVQAPNIISDKVECKRECRGIAYPAWLAVVVIPYNPRAVGSFKCDSLWHG